MLYHLLLLFFACVSLLRPPGAWDIHPLAMSGTQSIREALRVQTVRLVSWSRLHVHVGSGVTKEYGMFYLNRVRSPPLTA